jgi:hypothetical protein
MKNETSRGEITPVFLRGYTIVDHQHVRVDFPYHDSENRDRQAHGESVSLFLCSFSGFSRRKLMIYIYNNPTIHTTYPFAYTSPRNHRSLRLHSPKKSYIPSSIHPKESIFPIAYPSPRNHTSFAYPSQRIRTSHRLAF